MIFYVYIIKSSKTNKYYIGYTNNLERRLFEHNHNNTQSLKNKGPFILIYKEQFINKLDATKRERQIKSYKGGNEFKKLLNI
ncbi:endonuclease [Candidatus Roizmanbacteria bacterium CG_4_8_14_3_um_filter_34_9]|uniref:Endonuclease n=2 Tax=Candidatus Roizmaniibacteriota TaxID=1752723 RepID=A0A2M6YV52_9BACT|nr:MAG: endonuclease [Candidatus Roizmanbacteria bacterium CG07_land_8_20_14_0_80_34_15]PIW73235.1 MAG: endonuclease [Candidatus Roizmanbacteria bacterium CG_4_8_14_3_um_filter_34_9]